MKLELYKEAKVMFHGLVEVTDPCYDLDTWCRTAIAVLPGEYTVRAFYNKKENRIFLLEMTHATMLNLPKRCTCVGNIGVDSGTAGFFEHKPDYSDAEWNEVVDKMCNDSNRWKSPQFSIARQDTPEKCVGVYCSTGYGDGSYPVYIAKNANGDVTFVKILF